jgi:hypothetical protein
MSFSTRASLSLFPKCRLSTSGLGIKDIGFMKQLSVAYALLSEDKKAALLNHPNHADPASENLANDDNDEDNSPVQARSVNTNMVRGTVSAKDHHEKAKKAIHG